MFLVSVAPILSVFLLEAKLIFFFVIFFAFSFIITFTCELILFFKILFGSYLVYN